MLVYSRQNYAYISNFIRTMHQSRSATSHVIDCVARFDPTLFTMVSTAIVKLVQDEFSVLERGEKTSRVSDVIFFQQVSRLDVESCLLGVVVQCATATG